MSPSSPTEGQAMKEIIDTFRVSSAPGLSAAPGSIPDIGQQVQQGLADLGLNSLAAGQLQTGFWFTPPAEFQISFYSYYNGAAVENINFPKIARCVLTNVDMNYSQQNEMSLFRDGAPTNVQLSLRFREMRVITREDIALGY
jgi:hypothetical protein